MRSYLRYFVVALGCAAATLIPPVGFAAGGGGGGGGMEVDTKPVDPDYAQAEKAIKAQKWSEAIDLLNRAATRDEKNPDIYNYLGYAERHRGNMDAAFKHYDKALALNPKHRGVHEYLGEAYLMQGNLPKAEEQLAVLDKLCFFSCSEFRELREKIAEYKQKQARQ
jgi:tetratricopeptide (TPR) repeat protein